MLYKANEPSGFASTRYREGDLYRLGFRIRKLAEVVAQLRVPSGVLYYVRVATYDHIWPLMNTYPIETSLRRIDNGV